MPPVDAEPAALKKSNATILIGICSCHGHAEKRAAVRETWLNRLPGNVAALFFVGEGTGLSEPDVVSLPVCDDYASLPRKVQAFFRHALGHHDFGYLFKCDDDTYVFCDRLFELLRDGAEFVGSADFWPGHADGGAGYLLSRRAVGIAAEAACPESGPEDVWVSRTLREAAIELVPSPQLVYDYHRLPGVVERVITAHHCPPAMLREIHQWPREPKASDVAISCYARHSAWRGPVKLLPSGFFVGGCANPNGRWELAENGELLILRWFDWPKDLLRKTGLGYSNPELRLEILASGPLSETALVVVPDKLHLGCGPNILPGWRNYDIEMDIRLPLPFPDESLSFVFAEHVVEHVTPAEAWNFLKEVRRVLKPGGAARIIVPCVELISRRHDAHYAEFLSSRTGGEGSLEAAMHSIILEWGHQAIWTVEALHVLLGALGFRTATATPGRSPFDEFSGIDGHASSIGVHANWVESGIVEAVKWAPILQNEGKGPL